MKTIKVALLFVLIPASFAFARGLSVTTISETSHEVPSIEKVKAETKETVKLLYKQIIELNNEIYERSEMRFSDDLEKGKAVENAKLATKYVILASEHMNYLGYDRSELRSTEDAYSSTESAYLAVEQELRKILAEMKKIN